MIEKLKQSLKTHGYVGDTRLPCLIYLAKVSALLGQPVSLVVKGAASSGKSYALKCAQRYVPAEAYEQFEGMSEKALAYIGGKIDLKHKTLIIQEAAGMASGTGRVFLRQLLTEGSIRYMTVQKTKDGLKAEELIPVEGPCGLIMTTTANRLHHEDETRLISYHMEESPDHLRAIIRANALGLVSEPSEEELKPFHDLYRSLREDCPAVDVPFAVQLVDHLPTSHPRILRDFPKVISLIKASALVHSCSRNRGEDGEVIADLEDYRIVWEILGDTIAQGLDRAVPDGVRKVVQAVSELTDREDENGLPPACQTSRSVTQREIANHLGLDRSVISRHVHKALQDEYLVDDNPGQGRTSQIRLGSEELPEGTVLPHPDQLKPVQAA